jgi:flagellar M-ring protein FliF
VESILQNWQALDARRRLFVIIAAGLSALAAWGLFQLATAKSMELLYANLDPAAAGEVISALDQQGVSYRIDGTAIYVEGGKRDELRLTLAEQGLPNSSGVGYELLDNLSAFGTTSRMFDAAWLRAKEGELARTLVATHGVKAARVHISVPERGAFSAQGAASASVIVTASAGLSDSQARAMRHIVASAVEGLTPANVTLADSAGRLYPPDEDLNGGAEASDEAALKEKVERMLGARVGAGNVIVEVAIERSNDIETVNERTIDPESRVLISTEATESTTSEQGSDSGGVTVASNLPAGDAAGNGGQSQSNTKDTSERANYEVSETQRLLERAPGAVRRQTVAVLVGAVRAVDADGVVTFTPREAAELTALEDLVKSAVGFDEQRGDVVTLKSMDLEALADTGTEVEASMFAGLTSMLFDLAKVAILAVTTLVLALLVIKPLSRTVALPAPSQPLALPSAQSAQQTVETNALPDMSGAPALPPMGGGGSAGLPSAGVVDFSNFLGGGGTAAEPPNPAERLKGLVEQRRDETIALLKSWTEPQTVEEG